MGYSSDYAMSELYVGGTASGSIIVGTSHSQQLPGEATAYTASYPEVEVDAKTVAYAVGGIACVYVNG